MTQPYEPQPPHAPGQWVPEELFATEPLERQTVPEWHANDEPPVAAKSPTGKRLMAVAITAALFGGGVGGVVGAQLNRNPGNTVVLQQAAAGSSARPAGSVAAIAAEVTPSVVSIRFSSGLGSGSGSGFVIDSRGYILTNNHVVVDSIGGTLDVDLANGKSYGATIVGRNSAYDLAVIKINAKDLVALPLGDSSGLVVGDQVIAVGAPLGLEGTVTTGIVSALNRPVSTNDNNSTSYISAIQTDAAINPGNSGGPLVNAAGEVVGINSSIATMGSSFGGQSGSIGLGFAIPINQAKRVAEELINTGKSSIPIIGVSVDIGNNKVGGVISSVEADGPADKAGLKGGDVVTLVDNTVVRDSTEFIVALRTHNPGDKVKLTLSTGKVIELVLGSKVLDS